ncbi:MAG TPA: hypothetical protein VF801_04215 [Rhodocyclaceae bacterium]
MCATTALAVFLCFLMPPAVTAPLTHPAFDPLGPAALSRAAAQRLARGDEAAALILTRRAELLGVPAHPGEGAAAALPPQAPGIPALWPTADKLTNN